LSRYQINIAEIAIFAVSIFHKIRNCIYSILCPKSLYSSCNYPICYRL